MPRASFDGAGGNFDPQLRQDVAAYRRQSGLGGPGSRGGSRPPSRTGSNISLNSDDSPGGSGIRRSSSMRSGGRQQTRPTPVGFGSSTPRKASTPIMQLTPSNGTNGIRTASNSSMDRTPMTARYACSLPSNKQPKPLTLTHT